LDHVGIAVREADAVIPYYRDVLGLELVSDEHAAEPGTRLVYFALGDSFIQLVEPVDPHSDLHQWLEVHGDGIHHICFAADDLGKAAELCADPARIPVFGAGRNRRALFLTGVDPASVRIEVTETGTAPNAAVPRNSEDEAT
jgi:methylmalonyl-CoA/ethylmalonyl-CoA epimerase